MEKKSIISPGQVIAILFVTRLLFSTTYQSVLNAGNSIQDLLLSLPICFVIYFITAIPLLVLIRRHPNHDPAEIASNVCGKGIGAVVALLYCLFFLANAALTLGNFDNYFTVAVIPDVRAGLTAFLILFVCVYGAIKGIESIARVGTVIMAIYILTLAVIFASLIPLINLSILKPMLYNGPKYLTGSSVMNYNLGVQAAALAFLVPFFKPTVKVTKTFAVYNVAAIIGLFALEFVIVTVEGAYGSIEMYPLQTLSSLSKIGAFGNVESLDMISWILNAILTVTIYIYLAVSCLIRIGLNRFRRIAAIICGIALLFTVTVLSRNFVSLQKFITGAAASAITTLFIFVIPLILLITDIIKEKVTKSAAE